MSNRPTLIYELVPLIPTVDGYRNASVYMCGSVVVPGPMAIPWILPPQPSAVRSSPSTIADHPIVWRVPFPKDVVDSRVSWTKP